MSEKSTNKPFSTRLPDEARAELQILAQKMGLKEGDLGRMFILEKLAEAKSGTAMNEGRTLAAIIIAALSDTIDFEQARELVGQNLISNPTVAS